MSSNKNKKRIALLLLLLIMLVAAWLLLRKKTISREGFITQGTTKVSGEATIKIWDYSAVDGDTIDFYFDGKLVFPKLGLGDTPVIYNAGKLSKGEHWIGIKAITEGTNPPATPHISVIDGKMEAAFDIDAWKDSASGAWILDVE